MTPEQLADRLDAAAFWVRANRHRVESLLDLASDVLEQAADRLEKYQCTKTASRPSSTTR